MAVVIVTEASEDLRRRNIIFRNREIYISNNSRLNLLIKLSNAIVQC